MGSRVEELIGVAHAWDRAMVANEPEEIGAYMADDWTIIGPDGSVSDKTTFLELVRSGKLAHDVMESHDLKVRVYGDTAVVTARGVSGGITRESHSIWWSGHPASLLGNKAAGDVC